MDKNGEESMRDCAIGLDVENWCGVLQGRLIVIPDWTVKYGEEDAEEQETS